MHTLPTVVVGQYEEEHILGVFQKQADAETFRDRYNTEPNSDRSEHERARVEAIVFYPAGDPGRTGHAINVDGRTDPLWTCTCGANDFAETREQAWTAARDHVDHWTAEQP